MLTIELRKYHETYWHTTSKNYSKTNMEPENGASQEGTWVSESWAIFKIPKSRYDLHWIFIIFTPLKRQNQPTRRSLLPFTFHLDFWSRRHADELQRRSESAWAQPGMGFWTDRNFYYSLSKPDITSLIKHKWLEYERKCTPLKIYVLLKMRICPLPC